MTDAELVDHAVLRQFLLGIAEGLNAAREAVDIIQSTLVTIAKAYGLSDVDVVVFPTVIVVQTGDAAEGRVAVRSNTDLTFRFDQIAALYRLVREAKRGEVDPVAGIEQLNRIGSLRPRFNWPVRTLGHAMLTAGLALLLHPTWQGLVLAFGLGMLIGLLKLVRSPTLQLVFPVFASFICALIVFLLAPLMPVGNPLYLLIAPLATFLPGGVLATATGELAAGQMMAGASRLVTGLVQLALLSFGILAAASVAPTGGLSYLVVDPTIQLPWWAALAGIILYAVGIYLHFSAPEGAFGWVLLVLLVAYTGQVLGGAVTDPTVSGFIGALAMTPVVLWISSLRHGAPSQITFLPAFWLLVPGSASLASLTETVAGSAGPQDFSFALMSVISIALGVLLGTALYRFAHRGAEELQSFHIDLPKVVKSAPVSYTARLLPGREGSLWSRLGRRRKPRD